MRARNAIETAGVELAGRAEKATATTHEALDPGVYGEAAGAKHYVEARLGVKLRRRRERASGSSMHCCQKVGTNQRCSCDRANTKSTTAARKSERVNAGSEQAQLEAPPRVDPTEGRPGALKGTVPGNLHLPEALMESWRRRGKPGVNKMKRTLKMPYALGAKIHPAPHDLAPISMRARACPQRPLRPGHGSEQRRRLETLGDVDMVEHFGCHGEVVPDWLLVGMLIKLETSEGIV